MARMVLVRTTVGRKADAERLADALVSGGLAACVHILALNSTYVWKGRQESASEWLVEARALPRRARAVAARMAEGHPYELPLIETVPSEVSDAYVSWARSP